MHNFKIMKVGYLSSNLKKKIGLVYKTAKIIDVSMNYLPTTNSIIQFKDLKILW